MFFFVSIFLLFWLVITVPANFTEVQREETLKAAKMAGIDVKCLLNEPTAAGIACAYLNDFFYESDSSNVIIFDFGGGTLDISLLFIENNNKKLNFTVKAVDGDNHLGGRNFDEILKNYAIEKENLDRKNLRLMACARNAVIDSKILPSQQDEADIIIEYGDDIYTIPMTKSKFAELTKDLIDRIIFPVERVLKTVHMKPSDIDQIILNGGSSNLFFVKQKLTDYFGKEPYTPVDPQDAVAKGAAIIAYNIVNKVDGHTETPIIFKEVASRSIGVAQLNGKMSFHIHKNEGLPIVDRKEIYNNHDYLEGLSIPIFEGESENVEENKMAVLN